MTLWPVAHQAPLPMLFSRQEYLSRLPCPPPGDLSNTGMKPTSLMSPVLAGRFFTTQTTWEAPNCILTVIQIRNMALVIINESLPAFLANLAFNILLSVKTKAILVVFGCKGKKMTLIITKLFLLSEY